MAIETWILDGIKALDEKEKNNIEIKISKPETIFLFLVQFKIIFI